MPAANRSCWCPQCLPQVHTLSSYVVVACFIPSESSYASENLLSLGHDDRRKGSGGFLPYSARTTSATGRRAAARAGPSPARNEVAIRSTEERIITHGLSCIWIVQPKETRLIT